MDTTSLLNSRYRLERELGRGGCAITWLAQPLADAHHRVVIKELQLEKLGSWQDLSQFETEARLLEHLDYPHIPAFVELLSDETPAGKRLYLVQEWVEGQDLGSLLAGGRYFTEAEAIAIAKAVCEVLIYLHGFSPPMLHRDLKPGNLMLRERDQQVFVIDFGAVKGPATATSTGLTVTGTFGYMPLEQLEGRAVPASDLYALGMTLIHLLAHQEPVNLPRKGLKLDFRPHLNVSDRFARLLEKLIAPDPNQRYQTAKEALKALNALDQPEKAPKPPSSKPDKQQNQKQARQQTQPKNQQLKPPPQTQRKSARKGRQGNLKLALLCVLVPVGVGVMTLLLLGGPPEPRGPAAASATVPSQANPQVLTERIAAQLALAEQARAQGQPARCVEEAQRASELPLHPSQAQSRAQAEILRGHCLFEQKQYAQADTAFAKALAAYPAAGEAYYGLGLSLEQQGKDLEASRAYRSASMMPPNPDQAYYRLARIYERMKQPDWALPFYTKAINIKPDPLYVLARGKLQRQFKNCPAARSDFKAACAQGNAEACKLKCP